MPSDLNILCLNKQVTKPITDNLVNMKENSFEFYTIKCTLAEKMEIRCYVC